MCESLEFFRVYAATVSRVGTVSESLSPEGASTGTVARGIECPDYISPRCETSPLKCTSWGFFAQLLRKSATLQYLYSISLLGAGVAETMGPWDPRTTGRFTD